MSNTQSENASDFPSWLAAQQPTAAEPWDDWPKVVLTEIRLTLEHNDRVRAPQRVPAESLLKRFQATHNTSISWHMLKRYCREKLGRTSWSVPG